MESSLQSGVVWLIDGAYVLKGHEGRIDYIELRRQLQNWAIKSDGKTQRVGDRFDQIIFYNSHYPDNPVGSPFHDMLKRNGFQVKLFPLKRMNVCCEKCSFKGKRTVQKGVDVSMCTDLLSLAYEGKFKRVVITAGDGDFLDAIKKVQSMFRQVYISGYKTSMSKDLIEACDDIMWLDQKQSKHFESRARKKVRQGH